MLTKLFLRLSIGIGFLSAVADRFGLWPDAVSVWGNFENFLEYTSVLSPWAPDGLVYLLGIGATVAEIIFGVCLIIGFKTEFMAKLSGGLLLVFAISMTLTGSVKAPLDYGVFGLAAASFALSSMQNKFFELDNLF